jgi:hypothetical protein
MVRLSMAVNNPECLILGLSLLAHLGLGYRPITAGDAKMIFDTCARVCRGKARRMTPSPGFRRGDIFPVNRQGVGA